MNHSSPPRIGSRSLVASLPLLLLLLAPAEVGRSQEKLAARPLRLDRWQRHVIDSAKPWRSLFIAAEDLDGDGWRDLITGGWWYRNPGGPRRGDWERRELGAPLYNMATVFDFDRDGDFDVLGTAGKASDSNSDFVWARNAGDGSFQILRNIEPGVGDFLQGVAVADFLGPGSLAVALSWHQADKGIQLLTVPVDPSVSRWGWQRISPDSQDEQLTAGRIAGGVSPDLLLGTRWLHNNGGKWSTHQLSRDPGNPDRNRLADMNRDGRLDAVVGYQAVNVLGKLAWYEQPASPFEIWREHIVAEVIGPMSVDVGDLDRDGDLDVVVGEHNYANPETARLIICENTNGRATAWKQHVVHTGDEHHDGAVLVDIDADGDLDIVSIGWKEPEVWLYESRVESPEPRARSGR